MDNVTTLNLERFQVLLCEMAMLIQFCGSIQYYISLMLAGLRVSSLSESFIVMSHHNNTVSEPWKFHPSVLGNSIHLSALLSICLCVLKHGGHCLRDNCLTF